LGDSTQLLEKFGLSFELEFCHISNERAYQVRGVVIVRDERSN